MKILSNAILTTLYIDERRSMAEIAKIYGFKDHGKIYRHLIKNKIPIRTVKEAMAIKRETHVKAIFTPPVSKEEIKEKYIDQKQTVKEIAISLGISRDALSEYMRAQGIPLRNRSGAVKRLSIEENALIDAEICSTYQAGFSTSQIAELVDLSASAIAVRLGRYGLIRSRAEAIRLAAQQGRMSTVNKNIIKNFFEQWTPEMAWVLGVIYGDGHVFLNGRGFHVCGTKEVCEKVRKLLNSEATVYQYKKKNKPLNCYGVAFYSKPTAEPLISNFDLAGKKSHKLRFPIDIPAECLPSFIRGLWDSDGSWKNKKTSYSSCSEQFVHQVASILVEALNIENPRVSIYTHEYFGKECTIYGVHLRIEQARALYKYIYPKEVSLEAHHCSTKYTTATQYFAEEIQ